MKKRLLRIFSALLIASLSLFIVASAGCNESGADKEEKTFYIADKEITLYVGEGYKLGVGGEENLTFSSSDEKIVSVDETGEVIAVAEGVAFVKVSNGFAEKSCRFNVLKADNYIRLNTYAASVVVGGEIEISATVFINGKETEEGISFSCGSQNASLKASGNSAIFSAEETGYYEIEVKSANLTAKATVKAVSSSARILGGTELSAENCKTLKWNEVAGATGYTVTVNGEVAAKTDKTEFDIESYTAELLNGKRAVFGVSATAEADFDYIDGLFEIYVFSHEYERETVKEFTCVQAGEVKYTCNICGKSYLQDNFLAEHTIVDGKCIVCGKLMTEKILYLYDSENDCYYVGGADAGFDAESVYILSEYDDGTHGVKPVKYFGTAAFQHNAKIKRVIIPESITEFADKRDGYNIITLEDGSKVSSPLRGLTFDDCSNLEFVSAAGIHYLPAVDNGVLSYYHDNFRDCYNLTQIIVGENFYNEGRSWMKWINSPDSAEPKTDVYVKGTYIRAISTDYYAIGSETGANNNLLTGDVFYYDETSSSCFKWHFAEDGETIVSTGKHEFANGVCGKCGQYDNHGINYEYDDIADCYYVGTNKTFTREEAEILSVFDDGTHGERPVTYVMNGAFSGNTKIRKVVLPQSVTQLDGSVFQGCENLEYLSMTGIKDMLFANIERPYSEEKVTTNNNFLNCYKLTKLFVNADFNLYASTYDAQQFYNSDLENTHEPCIDIYVNADKSVSNVNCAPSAKNDLLTGKVYYKGNLDKCGRWNFDEDGNVVKSESDSHHFVGGICTVCGEYESGGVVYFFDGEKQVYYVAGYGGEAEEVTIIGEYDDGTNGKHNVTYIMNSAFRSNTTIKRVTINPNVTRLEGEVFSFCYNLEYVSMTGVRELTLENLSGKGIYSGEAYTTNNFMNCGKLTTLIVNKSFKVSGNQFTVHDSPDLTACVNIYMNGGKEESEYIAPASDTNNALLTGNVFYKGDINSCGMWNYDESGNIVVKYPSHNFVNGKCENCGEFDTQGIVYEYDSASDCYYVGDNKTLKSAEVKVFATYDDGTHGEKPVKYVAFEAFKGNAYIKKVVFPESVEHLRGGTFLECGNLEFVSMVGVKSLIYSVDMDNNFRLCGKLKTVIVGDGFTTNCGQFNGEEAKTTDIYVNGTTAATFVGNNNTLSGNVYYYSENRAENCWHYENGLPVLW